MWHSRSHMPGGSTPSHAVLRAAAILCAWANAVRAQCSFTDPEGELWVLQDLGGVQTATGGPGTLQTYEFDLCQNVNPVPTPCSAGNVLGTVALRYDVNVPSGNCEQLGPDINLNPTQVLVTRLPNTDHGVALLYSFFPLIGLQKTITFNLECTLGSEAPSEPQGTAQNVVINWRHRALCVTGPPDTQPGLTPAGSNWGWIFIGLFLGGGVVYLGGGVYLGRKDGKEGKAALPHLDFWERTLPLYVTDGIYFTRANVSTWHPILSFLAPSGTGGKERMFNDIGDNDEFEGRSSGVDLEKAGLVGPPPAQGAPAPYVHKYNTVARPTSGGSMTAEDKKTSRKSGKSKSSSSKSSKSSKPKPTPPKGKIPQE